MMRSRDSGETTSGAQANLEDLRQKSLNALLVFAACMVYAWILYLFVAEMRFLRAWYAPALLVLGGVLSYQLRERSVHLASHVLILGMMGANGCALAFSGPGPLSYSLALIVTFSSLLLSPTSTFLIALASMALIGVMASLSQAFPAMVIVLLTAVASWLCQRNLTTALQWAWDRQDDAPRLRLRLPGGQHTFIRHAPIRLIFSPLGH